MQLTLRRAAVIVGLLAVPGSVKADGDLTIRGAYYKERATRVTQPMLDARFDVGESGELRAHTLVDSISSASVAAGASGQAFDENRYEGGLSYQHTFENYRLRTGSRISTEPDYKSVFGFFRGELDLAQRNTTLGLHLASGRDSISNAGDQDPMASETLSGILWTSLASATISQIVSPTMIAQLTYDVSYLRGFQENPYRQVAAGGVLESERVPNARIRHAARATTRYYIANTETTLAAAYRLYVDTWGIVGHTPEARIVQGLASDIDLHLLYRLHTQTAADFFKPTYDSADPDVEPHLTDDAKLDELTTQTYGIKMDTALSRIGFQGPIGKGRLSALFEYITQSSYFGNAVAFQLAVTVPFSY